jgi:hypothetical protein
MWIEDMNSTIYSLIRGNTKKDISADYPNVFYTNDNENMSTTKFPCIYIHPIGTTETDSDLESTEINSAIFTQEVQITFNSDYEVDDLYTVLGFISREFKALRFQIVTNSTPYSNNGLKSISARYRRTIANGDNI